MSDKESEAEEKKMPGWGPAFPEEVGPAQSRVAPVPSEVRKS